jgi:hypothetical protein
MIVKNTDIRKNCTPELLKKLKDSGVKTTGHFLNMERLLTKRDFGLPVRTTEYIKSFDINDDGEEIITSEPVDYYVFSVEHKYQYMFFNYSDALAEEILLLVELNLLCYER